MLLRSLTKHVKDQNWFAVGLDFVIVVLGVLLAFQFTNWNEARQAKADYERALVDLQAQMPAIYFAAAERLSLADCRKQRYRQLGNMLRNTDDPWQGSPGAYSESALKSEDFPSVVRSPSRYFVSLIWQTEFDRGTFDLMDAEMRQALTSTYLQGTQAEFEQKKITQLESRLQALAYPLDLSLSDRLHFYEILSELDQTSLLLEVIAEQINARLASIQMHLPADEEARSSLHEFVTSQSELRREIYGDCAQPMVWPGLFEESAADP